MHVLFDQGTPLPIRQVLKGHTVRTAREQGWSTLANGELLRVAEETGFEVLLTTDQDISHAQDLKGREIAIVVLGKARWNLIRPMLSQVVAAVNAARPGSFTLVEIPDR